jgi:hypothetical protein
MPGTPKHVAWWVAAAFAAGCGGTTTPLADDQPIPGAKGAVALDQGWSAQTYEQSWFTSFGSRLLPYAWLGKLEQADSQAPFAGDAHMRRFGFLPHDRSALNPSGYPVGFTRVADSKGRHWVGLGCAACHTGEVTFRGKRIRLAGGQALLDFTGFEAALLKSLSATAADPAKFDRFAAALGATGNARVDLQNELIAIAQGLDARHRMNRTDVAYGHGRLDAFGQIFNAVAVSGLEQPENRRAPDAPVSFPVLWSAPHLDVVQWNGSAPNAGPGPLFQNVTTALAVYGRLDLTKDSIKGYRSTVDFTSLGTLQDHFYRLLPPRWPESILGAIDRARAGRGEGLYAQHCVSCHALADRDPKRQLEARLIDVDEVGTDPRMVRNFLDATVKTGMLEGRKSGFLAGPVFGPEARSIDVVIHATIGATLRHPLAAIRDAIGGYHEVVKAAIDQHPEYYKARPLDGVWASAPYLHNGSVPSLAELLTPPAQRVASFHVGGRELDTVGVGLETGAGPDRSLYDTTLPGNSNAGHAYGTDLDAERKLDLIEYLKTL